MKPTAPFALLVSLTLTFFLSATICGADNKQGRLVNNNWKRYGIIDVHAHIGEFRGYDLSEKTLLANLGEKSVALAFISNIDCAELPGITANLDEQKANNKTIEVVKQHPNLLRGLLWVRPQEKNLDLCRKFLSTKLEHNSTRSLFVGMKFHPDMNQFAADDTAVDAFLNLCQRFKIPAVFHCGDTARSGANSIYKVAKRHPHLPIVLYHMGFNTDHSQAIAVAHSALKNKDANLYLETSQCEAADVMKAVKEVGSQRVLFGTDATYFGKKHYLHYDDLISTLHQKLPARDFHNIVRDNARRLFPIE